MSELHEYSYDSFEYVERSSMLRPSALPTLLRRCLILSLSLMSVAEGALGYVSREIPALQLREEWTDHTCVTTLF